MQGLLSIVRRSLPDRVVPSLAILVALAGDPGAATPPRAFGQIVQERLSPQQREELYQSVALAAEQIEKQHQIIKQIVKLVRPAVVHIEAAKGDRRQLRVGQHGRVEEAGSGVVVVFDGKTYVLTNLHVIRYSSRQDITVKLHDGRGVHPTAILSDDETDVAVMAVPLPGLVHARLGDSSQMEIGDFVLAVGSPFGLSHSVTYGIVSAKGRHDLELGDDEVKFQDFIQTDAAINPGNSGGPLINLRGEVIGINTAIASASGGNEGIGFAIPVNMVKIIVRQLIKHGRVSRAFLGVKLDSKFNSEQALALGLPRLQGTRISGIEAGSPAERVRLQVDDVILSFGDVDIADDNHLVNVVGLTEVGKEVPIVVFRNRAPLTIDVRVGVRNEFGAGE
jgi:serine protease Do